MEDSKAKLDKVFSEYIRKRDTNNGFFRCISCGGLLPYELADCGHYIDRRHMATRFDETNCNAQCIKCNRFSSGNIEKYRLGLIKKYGEDKVLELESKKNCMVKYSDSDYKELIKHYQEEIKKLWNEKY